MQENPVSLETASSRRRLTSVLAIDVCGYSTLSERDERKAIEIVQRVSRILEAVTAKHNGRRFHRAGDGFLIEFQSANDSLNAALEVTEAIRNSSTLQGLEPTLCRIGLHAGEVTEQEDGDLLGHGVNIAARLQGEADEGGILASSNFMNLVSREFKGRKRRRGRLSLKNISEPIEAFDIESATSPLARTLIQLKRTLSHNALVFSLFGVLLIVIISMFGMTLNGQASQASIDAKVEAILNENFAGKVAGTDATSVDAAYMKSVLRRLGQSRQPSAQATFSLLEQGNIMGAIEALEESLKDTAPADLAYQQTLHQIGVLAHYYAPMKAVAAYEGILVSDPDNLAARQFLARLLRDTGEVERSTAIYDRILSSDDLDQLDKLRTQLDIAFNLHLQEKNDEAEALLVGIEDEVLLIDSAEISAAYNTERGIILERLGRFDEAESYLIAATTLSKTHGYDYQLERAYNVLGLIALKRVEDAPDRKTAYLGQAKAYFERQYDISKRIDKKRAEAEALYFLGDIDFRLENFDDAEKVQLEALRLAIEHSFESSEFLARIGLAEIANARGKFDQSCRHLKAAETLYAEKLQGRIGPVTAGKIKALPCAFSGLD